MHDKIPDVSPWSWELRTEGSAEEQNLRLPTKEAENCQFVPLPELSQLPQGCPFCCPFPSPMQFLLAWALLASQAAGPAWDSVPRGLTFWVEPPLVNPASSAGSWVSGAVSPLAPLHPGQSAGPFPSPGPPSLSHILALRSVLL